MDGGRVTVYTDGACSGNPGPGGWGAVLLFDCGEERRVSGGCKETTNNRMELTAVIEALVVLDGKHDVCINTDSIYVKNGITSWIHTWKLNGWKTSGKSAVKNVDLWMRLEELVLRHNMEWKWVKGHSGDKYNEEADVLARREVERQLALL
ncbi:ribonuclease HI [Anaplasma bovis]|uniref:ribonuclease HI n=1 Tax=Anaplasma bovis TaxID=186733 RepID=UPI002FEFFE9B